MPPSVHSSWTRSLATIGLELLPWMLLTGGLTLYSPSVAQGLLPYPRLLLPLIVLGLGGAAVFGRRRWNGSGTDTARPREASPEASPLTAEVAKPELDGAHEAPDRASNLPAFGAQPLLITTRSDRRILAANRSFEQEFGYAARDIVDSTPSDIGLFDREPTVRALQHRLSPSELLFTEDVALHTARGTIRRVPLSLHLAQGGQQDRLIWSFPVEEHSATDRDVETRMTGRDALTGLADRTSFLQQIAQRLENQSTEDKGPPALLSVIIHEYGDVADSFGHDAGQQLLTAAASRIQDEMPPTATTARIAENTFAVLLPQTDPDQAKQFGRALLEAFKTPFQIDEHQVPIEASVGVAIRSSDEPPFRSAEQMLQAGYSAMHNANRQNGPNLYVSENGNHDGPRRLHRREHLRRAIHEDELTLRYQPIVHLVTGSMVGAEALVRWNHPERGLLSPADFVPLAEKTGLIGDLDRWVFEEALRQAETWTNRPDPPLEWVSVNVSPQSIQEDIESWCKDKLCDVSLPDGALHLEITERWALRDDQSLRSLRDNGARIAIDDFGTGYSSLQYLRSLDADTLKIDREFIEHLGQDPETTAIVQFLLNLSLRLDVGVIAEGVETAEQATILRELGCAMAQGYHFSKPIAADALFEQAGRESPLASPRSEAAEETRAPISSSPTTQS